MVNSEAAVERWRYELQLDSDPPVTYILGAFLGCPTSMTFPVPIPEGVNFKIVAMAVEPKK